MVGTEAYKNKIGNCEDSLFSQFYSRDSDGRKAFPSPK